MSENEKLDKTGTWKASESNATWSITLSGVSAKSGFLVQVTRTRDGSLDDVIRDLGEATKMMEERNVGAIAPTLAEGLAGELSGLVENIVSDSQPSALENDLRTIFVNSLKLLFTDNSKAHLVVKGSPGLMKHGIFAWPEIFVDLGTPEEIIAKYGVAKEIPVPDDMRYAQVIYKDGKAKKVALFSKDNPNQS